MFTVLLACADPCAEVDRARDDALLVAELFPVPEEDPPDIDGATMTWHWDQVDQEAGYVAFHDEVCRVVPADTAVRVGGDAEWMEGDIFRYCEGDEWETVAAGERADLSVELGCGGALP